MKYRAIACLTVLGLVSACGGGGDEEVVVPQSCLDALNDADTVIALATQGLDYSAEGFAAAGDFDTDGLLAAAEKLGDLAPQARSATQTYDASRTKCRSAAD